MTPPTIATEQEWQAALDRIRAKEKELTRAHDALAAERRRLPWVRIEKDYVFQGSAGSARLVDLFDGRRQLVLYHFMLGPNQTAGCAGCSMVLDQLTHLAHLHARNTSFAVVSRAPIAVSEAYRKRMGWDVPWYSSFGTSFNPDFGRGPVTPDPSQHQDGERFGMSAFIRDDDAVYRTYFTTNRGVETLGPVWTLLDLTALGRQEDWEDSPDGIARTPRYGWWKRHDEYGEGDLRG